MSLAPEAMTCLARPEASGFAVSRHLLLWRFPFNGLFRADTSEGSSVGRGKRRPLSSFAAALEGRSQSAPATGIWKAGPAPSAQAIGGGGARGRGGMAGRVTRILPAQRVKG